MVGSAFGFGAAPVARVAVTRVRATAMASAGVGAVPGARGRPVPPPDRQGTLP